MRRLVTGPDIEYYGVVYYNGPVMANDVHLSEEKVCGIIGKFVHDGQVVAEGSVLFVKGFMAIQGRLNTITIKKANKDVRKFSATIATAVLSEIQRLQTAGANVPPPAGQPTEEEQRLWPYVVYVADAYAKVFQQRDAYGLTPTSPDYATFLPTLKLVLCYARRLGREPQRLVDDLISVLQQSFGGFAKPVCPGNLCSEQIWTTLMPQQLRHHVHPDLVARLVPFPDQQELAAAVEEFLERVRNSPPESPQGMPPQDAPS